MIEETDNNWKLHPDKANVLWCSLNNRAVKDVMPEVSIGGKVIKRDHSLRYLGIVFDRSLSGKDHISRVVSKARKGLNALKVMAYMNMPQRILLILYQTLVLSVVDYGFWASHPLQDSVGKIRGCAEPRHAYNPRLHTCHVVRGNASPA